MQIGWLKPQPYFYLLDFTGPLLPINDTKFWDQGNKSEK